MKISILIPLFFALSLPFSSQAAEQITQAEEHNLTSIGTVSVTNQSGSPDDIVNILEQKASKAGANYFRIIGINNPGDSSHWIGVAEIYK
ncbi:DUF1471 domain-containing protein [Klebsiella variicola]|uniref:DUF1471 domain-containing protein n=1 Tax=Klebsiella variicola TaxID=244366 RepID=UPI002FFBA1A1